MLAPYWMPGTQQRGSGDVDLLGPAETAFLRPGCNSVARTRLQQEAVQESIAIIETQKGPESGPSGE